jgi:glycosyltransferase involved in cell wall biosynthesis
MTPTPGMRVAAIIDTVQVSGPGRQLAALASCLRPQGVDIHVITFHRTGRSPSPYLAYLERAGVAYSVVEEAGPLDARLLVRLRRLLAELAPDIVQTHGYKPTALVWALRRAGASWRWISFYHGATSENLKVKAYHWLNERVMGGADRVIVMSRAHVEGLSRLGSRVDLLYNAAIPLPGSTSAEPQAVRHAGPPRIGVVGRLSPEKGVDIFLHACRALLDRGLTFTGVVAGDGPERRRLEQLRDSLGLGAMVSMVGATETVERLYATLEVLVIPSRSEGLPNVLLEGLRAGLPVVATRVGAIPEVLDSPLAGVVVPPGSAAALADGIVAAIPLKSSDAARSARRAILDRFSVDRRAAQHVALYADLLGRTLARDTRPRAVA